MKKHTISELKLAAEVPNEIRSFKVIVMAMLALVAVVSMVSSLAQARKGGDISGGGTGCFKPGKKNPYFLLDFAPYANRIQSQRVGGEQISDSLTLQRLAFNTYEFKNTKAFRLMLERLSLWKSEDTGKLTERILEAEQALNVLITTNAIAVETPLFEDQQTYCQAGDVSTIALYYHDNVAISIERWNQLDLRSQAGVILHETLRRLQISENQNYTLETEKQLRNFVAHIMLFAPKEDPNFNFGKESDRIVYSRLEELRGLGEKLRAPVCKLLKEWSVEDLELGSKLMKRQQEQDCFLHPESIPQDIREREDTRTANCMIGNGRIQEATAEVVAKYRSDLEFLSGMIQETNSSSAYVRHSIEVYCGEPVSRAWSINNKNIMDQLDEFISFTTMALQTRSVKTSDLASPQRLEEYRSRASLLAQVLTYFNHTLRTQYRESDIKPSWSILKKAFNYRTSSKNLVTGASKYIESDSSQMAPAEKEKIEAAIVQLRATLEGLMKDGLLM